MATPLPAPSSPVPVPESMRRSPSIRGKHSSFSSIAVGDAIDTDDIQFETSSTPRTAFASATVEADDVPLSSASSALPTFERPARLVVTQPIPKSSKVGPHNFEKLRILGAGSTGRVYLVRSVGLDVDAYYAMKVVKKSELIKRNRVQRILTERQILSVANHPFVVTLHYCFQTADFFYLVMQYCAGGELFSFLRSQENHRLCEAHAKFYAAEVLIALEYLHLIGIIYRDLKPENILVHESGHVMLSDFDLAHEVKPAPVPSPLTDRTYSALLSKKQPPIALSPTISTTDPELWFRMRKHRPTNRNIVAVPSVTPGGRVAPRKRRFSCPCVCMPPEAYPHMDTESHINLGEKRTSFVGTHEYVAPEIIAEEGYVGSVDWWAFGILLYEMMYGVTPFKGHTQVQTLENILDISEEIEFPPEVPISDECRDLIDKLLAKSIDKRLQNPLLIKSHPFFKGLVWPLIRHQQPPIIPAMVHSLEEKQFSDKEMSEFDDEVPYHRAVGSPRRRSRRTSVSSLSSNSSTVHMLSIAQLSCDGESMRGSWIDATGESEAESARENSPVRAAVLPAYVSQSWAQPGDLTPTKEESRSPEKQSPMRIPSPPPSPSSRARRDSSKPGSPARSAAALVVQALSPEEAAIAANTTDGVVHDFEFVSNQQRNYWSSHDSHRSLTAKLSQLDMAALELGPEEEDEDCDLEEGDEEDGDVDDEEATPVDLQGSLTGMTLAMD